MSDATAPLLEVRSLEKSFHVGGRTLEVLRGVDFRVREGEILAIVGASGSGKSTLLHHIGLLDRPDRGEIRYRGAVLPLSGPQAAFARNRRFGFVFQFYHLLPEFTALENVTMPALILEGFGVWRRRKKEWKERGDALLERMGLGERKHHRPTQLSGGERQRVAIARALMLGPGVLLCDEPTGNLDRRTAESVRELLWNLNRQDGQTLIVVTHDQGLARQAHRTLHLVDGRVEAA